MSELSYVLFLLTTMAGSFIQSVCGFGCAIFTMSLFPYFMPYSTSVTLTGLTALSSNIGNILPRIKHIKWKLLISPFIGYFAFAAVSIIFSVGKSENQWLNAALGVVLILLSLYFAFFKSKIKIKPTFLNGLIVGALSGILGGLFSISSPPIVVYSLACTDSKDEYFATNMAFLMVTNIYAAILRAIKGLIDLQMILLWALGTLTIIIGVFFGKKVADKLNAELIRKLIYIFMALNGILMLI